MAFFAGCGGPLADVGDSLLFDREQGPDVLVEERVLAPPPDVGTNRLVRGWTPWRREDGTLWTVAGPQAAVEFVELAPRARKLVFDGVVLSSGEAWAEVLFDGGNRRVALTPRLVFDLPPAGRSGSRFVRLRLAPGTSYAARAVGVEPSLESGSVDCEQSTCRQSAPSIFETVRRVRSGSRLVATFAPPKSRSPELSFRLVIERESAEPRSVFFWGGSWLDSFRGERRIDVELPGPRSQGSEGEWVRLRFEAQGQGAEAVWRSLRLWQPPEKAGAERGVAPEIATTRVPKPPRVVIVYVLDALRADYISHLGGEAGLTPVIDELASHGVTFLEHRSPAPNTLPSSKTLLTGQTFFLRGGWKLTPDGPRTLAETYAQAGYRTGLFSANGNVSSNFGTDRGFKMVEKSVLVGPGYWKEGPGYSDTAERIHRAALSWLDSLDVDDRAFLYLHTLHPHTPYDPPPELARTFVRGIDSRIDGGVRVLRGIGLGRVTPSEEDRRRIERLYAASVAYNDRELGVLLREIRSRFRREEVLLVVTSDHGEELFDHGGVLHGYTLYEELLHIPAVLHWPGTLDVGRVDRPTGTADLHDALRALVDAAWGEERPGIWQDLASEDADPSLHPGPYPDIQFAAASAVPGGIFSARTKRWKLIWAPQVGGGWGMGGGKGRNRDWEYLFDLSTSPGETANLAGARNMEVDWLRSRLRAWIESGTRSEAGGEEAVLDEETRGRLRALGYLD